MERGLSARGVKGWGGRAAPRQSVVRYVRVGRNRPRELSRVGGPRWFSVRAPTWLLLGLNLQYNYPVLVLCAGDFRIPKYRIRFQVFTVSRSDSKIPSFQKAKIQILFLPEFLF